MRKPGERTIKRIVKRINDIIDVHAYLQVDKNGYYHDELYADYRDKFEERTIVEMFKAQNPREKFYESLDFFDYECDCRDELIKMIKEHFNDNGIALNFDKYEDYIRDWVNENIYYTYPYDHYLKQDVYIDIIVDTGDANYDYTKNELFGCKYSDKGLSDKEESALVWLMQQQGYGMDAITDFVENKNMQGSTLLESIYQECINTTTCMNALAFFVKITLREAFDLHDYVNNIRLTENGYEKISDDPGEPCEITLTKDTACGLYDTWNGAGSVLDIKLEKDVVLPMKYIDSALPDGSRGCSITSIYGMSGSFWTDNSLTIAPQKTAA